MKNTAAREVDYETAAGLVTAAAYEVPDGPRQTCPTCGDEDWRPGRRTVVHTWRGGFGADNDLADVLADLRRATTLLWRDGIFGPVVFASLPDDRGVAVDVLTAPPAVTP